MQIVKTPPVRLFETPPINQPFGVCNICGLPLLVGFVGTSTFQGGDFMRDSFHIVCALGRQKLK